MPIMDFWEHGTAGVNLKLHPKIQPTAAFIAPFLEILVCAQSEEPKHSFTRFVHDFDGLKASSLV